MINITDVGHLTSDADTGEDKVEKKARESGQTAKEVTTFFTKIFFQNKALLNHLPPTTICAATEHIPEMISLIQALEEKGVTYQIGDGVYFDVTKFAAYGKLSGNKLEDLKTGARVEVNPEKRHPVDFALWKLSPPDQNRQMEWNSPWGRGFPGWHIECSAMANKYLGPQLDIHTGGEDNIFPHHECEIAQSETVTGKPFAQFWVHTRFLRVEGEKMSKSKQNFFTLQDLIEKGFEPLALRYLFLSGHYRSSLNFTWKGLEAAQTSLHKLRGILTRSKVDLNQIKRGEPTNQFIEEFLKAVNSDLNLPQALAVTWSLLKSELAEEEKVATLLKFDQVLGLDLEKELTAVQPEIPEEVQGLLDQREAARRDGKWEEADRFRAQIEELGFVLEDTPQGPRLLPNRSDVPD